tara:strand:+ start:1332 stop:1544 length:213 start_codon:yes stop_codon:yes gene_type:complete
MALYSNVVYNNGVAYKILNIVAMHNFADKRGNINKQVLGMYVNENGGDHVLQRNNKFLICETIQEATIIE